MTNYNERLDEAESWVGDEIPEEYREHHGGKTHYLKTVIGMEYGHDVPPEYYYDGVSEWHCAVCHTRWGRWTGKELADGELEERYGG